jgi:hypothetical protein
MKNTTWEVEDETNGFWDVVFSSGVGCPLGYMGLGWLLPAIATQLSTLTITGGMFIYTHSTSQKFGHTYSLQGFWANKLCYDKVGVIYRRWPTLWQEQLK